MKTTFTSKLFLFLSLTFAFAACNDKEEDDATPDIIETAACRLTDVTDNDEEANKVEYNSSGFVVKLTETDEDDEVYTTTFIYDANNRLIKEESRENGQLDDYTTYEYTNNLITTSKYYDADGTLEDTEVYKYDGNNRIVEISDDSNYKTTFTYDANGNVTKVESFDLNRLTDRQVYENYDDKPTALSAVKGLFFGYAGVSKNNPGKATYYYDADGDGVLDTSPSGITTYTYKYNNNGYPTQIIETDEDNDTYTTNYTYQCE